MKRSIAAVGVFSTLAFGLGSGALRAQSAGTITTVAGNGTPGTTGDGGPATNAELGIGNLSIAPDYQGNLYILDQQTNHLRKVTPAGIITTIGGGGTAPLADGTPVANVVSLPGVGLATDSAGNIYVCGASVIWKIDAGGILHLVGGNALGFGFSGDGGPAINAQLGCGNISLDGAGNIYFPDAFSNHIRKIDTNGIITTIGGNGKQGYSGDGGPAVDAEFFLPGGLSADSAGNVYFTDNAVYVRKIDTKGIITTVAGNGSPISISEGVAATSTGMDPTFVAVDGAGNLFISDTDRVREVNTSGIINTVAGGITNFTLGDNGPALKAQLLSNGDVEIDNKGNLYIADNGHYRAREVLGIATPKKSIGTGGGGGGGSTPTISANGVANGASFAPEIVPGSWATIQGSNLSPVTDTWDNFIVDGKLPTVVDGVSVTVGFGPAYVYYVSPTQINFIVPPDISGSLPVTVKTPSGSSAAVTVTVNSFGPAFFAWPNNQVVATRQDFSFAVKTGTFAGTTTTPAKPGDTIILWGTGFGSTIPAAPPGIATPSSKEGYNTATKPIVEIDNVAATVYGAALAPGLAGLYQVAIQVPTTLGNGDWPVVATIGGVSSPSGMVLTVQQ